MEKSIDDNSLSISAAAIQPDTITFEAKEVIIKGNNIESTYPEGLPINFDNTETLVFSINNKKYTYKKVDE